jgi:hypothetical protein
LSGLEFAFFRVDDVWLLVHLHSGLHVRFGFHNYLLSF